MTAAVELLRDLQAIGIGLTLHSGKIRAVGRTSELTDELVARVRRNASELTTVLRSPSQPAGGPVRHRTSSPDGTPTATEWERFWAAYPEERPVIVPRTPEASPHAGMALAHVSSVNRPPRYRLSPLRGEQRVCCVCGEGRGPDGPLGYAWDVHLIGGEMLLSCSSKCRAKRGLSERKPLPLERTST